MGQLGLENPIAFTSESVFNNLMSQGCQLTIGHSTFTRTYDDVLLISEYPCLFFRLFSNVGSQAICFPCLLYFLDQEKGRRCDYQNDDNVDFLFKNLRDIIFDITTQVILGRCFKPKGKKKLFTIQKGIRNILGFLHGMAYFNVVARLVSVSILGMGLTA